MANIITGKVKAVSKFGGIMLFDSDAWLNPKKGSPLESNIIQNKEAIKGNTYKFIFDDDDKKIISMEIIGESTLPQQTSTPPPNSNPAPSGVAPEKDVMIVRQCLVKAVCNLRQQSGRSIKSLIGECRAFEDYIFNRATEEKIGGNDENKHN